MTTNYIYRKTAKMLSNGMNFAEKIAFKLFIRFSKKNTTLYRQITKDWEMMLMSKQNQPNFNENTAWESMAKRLTNEELLPKKQPVLHAWTQYVKYAAAIVIIAISTSAGYFYFNPKIVTITNEVGKNTIIKTLPDGTNIFLAQGSSFSYPVKFRGNRRNVKLNGEAFFEVAKNPKKPFIVETNKATVRVLGTSFNLKTNGNFELEVVEGKVGVDVKNSNRTIIALAGDKVIASREIVQKVKLSNMPTAIQRVKRLQFQDEMFQNIINVINRNYGSNIVLAGEDLKQRRISVTFENELSSIVSILSVSFNLQITRNNDGTVILSEKK
ncbi:MAG TPA: FecR family protein [Tenuifilaceae bacterium]|nr:FecR family protein [Tenuifilaceae bacterium]